MSPILTTSRKRMGFYTRVRPLIAEAFRQNPTRKINEVAKEFGVSAGYAQKIHAELLFEGEISPMPAAETKNGLSWTDEDLRTLKRLSGYCTLAEICHHFQMERASVARGLLFLVKDMGRSEARRLSRKGRQPPSAPAFTASEQQ
jgi:hypothetical protein